MEIPKEKLKEMYRMLLCARLLGDKLFEMYVKEHQMPWYHEGLGQEAMPIALCANLRKDDYLKLSYRLRYCCFYKGVPIRSIIGYELGKTFDPGKDHVDADFSLPHGLLGISGSLGEDIPIYVGAAVSAKYRKTGQVVACCFGDGTSNRGPVHEGMNMAAVWKLPIVFICENNQYALSTPFHKSVAIKDISTRAEGYGMPGATVDGNDLISCYEVVHEALERARKGLGPSLVEAKTFRLGAHFVGDDQSYRPKGEVEEAKKKDPLARYKEKLLKMGVLTAEEERRIEKSVRAEIEDEVKKAVEMPDPKIETLAAFAVDTL